MGSLSGGAHTETSVPTTTVPPTDRLNWITGKLGPCYKGTVRGTMRIQDLIKLPLFLRPCLLLRQQSFPPIPPLSLVVVLCADQSSDFGLEGLVLRHRFHNAFQRIRPRCDGRRIGAIILADRQWYICTGRCLLGWF